MKNSLLIILAAFALVFTACQKEEIVSNELTTIVAEGANFQEEMPNYDVQIRSLNQTKYVKEISFLKLSGVGENSPEINFEESTFIDNGRHHDLVANDGIYTSTRTFVHNAQVPYRD